MYQQGPRKNYQNNRTGVFGKLDLEKTGQGRRLRTSKTDSVFGKGKSFVSKVIRAKSVRGKMQLKNLSEENIRQIDNLISDKLKKHVSRETAYLTRKEARDIKIKAYKIYKNSLNFSKEDFKDLKRAVGAIRAGGDRAKKAMSILRTSGISSDNNGVFKSPTPQNATVDSFFSKTDQSKSKPNKNDFQFGYKFGNNEDKAEKEKNKKVDINLPPDEEIEDLRNKANKAKDLPI